MKDIEQLKSLWKSLFGDTEAFISLFFHEVVREENIRVLEEKGRILSALYMLPYPFRIWNQEVTASYISGAGTLPEAQGRGLMRRLLIDSFKEMERRQIPLSILIPAEPWLYGFYEKSGYATVFAYNQQVYPPKEQRFWEKGFSCKEDGVRLVEDSLQQREDSLRYRKDGLQCGEDDLQYSENGLKYGEDAILLEQYSISDLGDSFLQKREDLMGACFSYFDQRLRERNACILHSYTNFRTIVHDYAISDGKIWVALNSKHIPVGIIFTVPAGGSSFVAKELVADSEEVKEVLLRTALNHYHASSGIYRTVVPHASPTADFSAIAKVTSNATFTEDPGTTSTVASNAIDSYTSSSAVSKATTEAGSIGTSEVVSNTSSEEGQTIPFGMARIIDANKMLSMWAAVNPERRLIIHLSDPLLTNNNGSYCIESGKCYKTTNNKYNDAFEVLTMDIGQLAHFLICPEYPFMSLMFD